MDAEVHGIPDELSSAASKCALCGFCQAVCPTIVATGRESHGPRGRVLIAGALARGDLQPTSSLDPFYTCLGCRACYYACPAGIDVWELSREARRLGASHGEDPLASAISSAISGLEDPLGLGEREVSGWSEGLGIPSPEEAPGRPILITGHMYQLMSYVVGLSGLRRSLGDGPLRAFARAAAVAPRLLSLSKMFVDRRAAAAYDGYLRNIASLLRAAGVDFSYDPHEPYPGTLLYELGHDEEFSRYARSFADYLRRSGASRVITVDPHTYDLLSSVYPRYVDGFDREFDILHYSELLGGLGLKDLGMAVAYHEPCHLVVRDEGDQLTAIGDLLGRSAKVFYSPRSGRRNFCCGGPVELLRGDVAAEVSLRRFRELKGLGADLIVTACPICHANLNKDGSVVDASEVLAAAAGLHPLGHGEYASRPARAT
ncbi:(Fe-S)-binding protein [Conexivisphaera calida]|uniref:Motif=4Fe-4S ferredoxins, iron-sulfur binding region signature n=1 Tax=Conexivisphaera calida TaxID=1874277 RepID=A0A4P2VDM9_9ARCH|nr:(Fe-S)-binding protein [Conexivisphaera calida]BBE42736.1 motif=4Fe-4S ferredoxins, iron-sulfur binding region signature [Conexivisphaera calida]